MQTLCMAQLRKQFLLHICILSSLQTPNGKLSQLLQFVPQDPYGIPAGPSRVPTTIPNCLLPSLLAPSCFSGTSQLGLQYEVTSCGQPACAGWLNTQSTTDLRNSLSTKDTNQSLSNFNCSAASVKKLWRVYFKTEYKPNFLWLK